MKPKHGKRSALFGTAIFFSCLATPAFAVEIAGQLIIDLDPADYNPVTGIWNQHTATGIQGPFNRVANATPQKTTIGGATAIVLDGDADYLVGPNTNPILDGTGQAHSMEFWAFQGQIKPEEAVLSWGKRDGPDGTLAGGRYSSNPDYGASARWGQPDMGFAGGPPAVGSWHLITITYDGSPTKGGSNTQNVYVDGVLNATEATAVALDAKDNVPFNIGAERNNDNSIASANIQYSGAVGKMRVHNAALTAVQVLANYNEEKAGYPGITAEPLPRGPLHRFSFSNAAGAAPEGSVVTDSVGGLSAKVMGTGATFTGTKLQLPGGPSSGSPAYLDLPNGLISSKQRISIEVWSTQTAKTTWSRVMSFGTSTIGEVTAAGNPGFNGGAALVVIANAGDSSDGRLVRNGGTISNGADFRASLGGTVTGTQLHQVVEFDPDRKEWRMYRNGYLMECLPETQGPTTIPDVNNWLGRSEYNGDQNFNGTFDEFRIYNYTLTESQIRGNTLAGPDVVNVSAAVAQGTWQPTTAGTFSYSTAGNWNPAVVPNGVGVSANLSSDLTGDETVELNAAVTVGALTIGDADGTNKFNVTAGSGGSLTFDAGIGQTAALTQKSNSAGDTISAPVMLTSETEIGTLGLANGPALTLAGSLSGSGRFAKTGPGTVVLTADNSGFTGEMAAVGGTLKVGNGGTTGTLGSGPVVTSAGGRLVLNRSDATTLSPTITGSGFVQQDGPGPVTFTGSINMTGNLGIKSGTTFTNQSAITLGSVNVNGQLAMSDPAAAFTATRDFNVGDLEAGPSSVILSDGTITGATLYVGKNVGTNGVIVQTGGEIIDAAGGVDSRVGGNAVGTSGVFGAWRVLGGKVTLNDGNFQIGGYGTGVMEVAGGNVNFNAANYMIIGRYQDGTNESYGLLDISSGSLAQNNVGTRIIVGEEGFGTLNVRQDGVLTCVGGLLVGASNTGGAGSGTVNLSGNGIILTQLVDQGSPGSADGSFNFHGGLLRARGDNTAWFQNVDNAVVWNEGLFIDTNGKRVTSNQLFSDPTGNGVKTIPVTNGGSGYLAAPFIEIVGDVGSFGATAVANLDVNGSVTSITVTNPGQNYTSPPTINLRGGVGGSGLAIGLPTIGANVAGTFTKQGEGRLTLTGFQSYTGPTVISQGTISANGSLESSSGITVDPIGFLAGTGNVPKVTVNGTLRPGDLTGTLTTGTLTFNTGSNLLINIDDSQTDPALVNGNVVTTGNVSISNVNLQVNVIGGGVATKAPYVIFSTGGNVTGSFASVPPGVEYTVSGGTITLTKVASPFQAFIAGYFPGVTDPAIIGPDADPDKDGTSNQVEFALGGDPSLAGDGPKVFTLVADSSDAGTEKELLMTLAVLPGFPAAPAATGTYKGVSYQIQGSLDLLDFTSPVSQVDPVTAGLPAVPAGYEYRTFRLDASNGLPNKGFLRVQVK